MERRHDAGYKAMRDSLIRSGIKSPEEAQDIIKQSKKRAQKILGVGVVIFLLIVVLWPKAAAAAFCLWFFMLIWVGNSAVNGKRYIQQYIDEEMQSKE